MASTWQRHVLSQDDNTLFDDGLASAAFRADRDGLLRETARQAAEVGRAQRVDVGVVAGPDLLMRSWNVELGEVSRIYTQRVVPIDSAETVARAVRRKRPVTASALEAPHQSAPVDLAVPMVADREAVGVIEVRGGGFDSHASIGQVCRVASTAALAWEHLRIRNTNRKALEETITVLAAVIEGRDAYTESHCLHLAEMSLALGVRMGFDEDGLDRLNFGGLLHDIGKIAVSDTVLAKPGRLTDREFDEMKAHASIGEDILTRITSLADVAPIVGQHHERVDGSGYPHGLKGEEILLEARILAVVDAFDAMTTARPYRGALPWSRAVEEISSGAGSQFDPSVVELFLQYITGEEAQWKRNSPI